MIKDAYIVSACRTPIASFQSGLKSLSAVDLGTVVVEEAIRRAGISKESVQEVIMGNVLSAGLGQNPARQTALGAGVPVQVAALTINKVCGSGLKAVMLAAQGIRVGDVDVMVAGGMESMSNAPFLLPGVRGGLRLGHGQILDSMVHDGLWDAYENYHMGCTAEVVAARYGVSRQDQDQYAVASHSRAIDAVQEGHFQEEIVPVRVPGREEILFERDEGPREQVSLESLAQLKPAFQEDGTVTAGNASQISDGAAALTLLSEHALQSLGAEPMARVVASATTGIEPSLVMMAPMAAIHKVRERAGWKEEQVDLYEVNEAFAAQLLALIREVPLNPTQLNVHGGAVALGHPIGASGARILTTLLHALKKRGLKKGIASLCLGGGNAVATAVELI
ncbi:MAG: acetyl-CoA C-acetyltransferase [Acidobacteriota bacterium]